MDKGGNVSKQFFFNGDKVEYLLAAWRFFYQIQGAKYQIDSGIFAHIMNNSDFHFVLV